MSQTDHSDTELRPVETRRFTKPRVKFHAQKNIIISQLGSSKNRTILIITMVMNIKKSLFFPKLNQINADMFYTMYIFLLLNVKYDIMTAFTKATLNIL